MDTHTKKRGQNSGRIVCRGFKIGYALFSSKLDSSHTPIKHVGMMTKILLSLLLLLFRVHLVFSFTTNKGVMQIQKASTSLRGSGIGSFPTTTTTTTSTTHLCVKPPNDDDDENEDSSAIIQPVYLMLATAETIFWYYLAPGIDPDSRWFNVATDGELISQLLNPSIVLTTQGYAYSSLLLNSFLILPSVWALLLLQEKDSQRWQWLSPLPFCVAGFFVGGGALIPYMIVRKSPDEVDPNQFSSILKIFENKQSVGSYNTMTTAAGPPLLVGLTTIILGTFLAHAVVDNNGSEWTAFVDRLHHSQFTSLALFDFIMLSCTIIDPISDDAKRRGYYGSVWPFLFPLVGPVAWIVQRPKYTISEQ